jgi:hypothetical protein
LVLEKKLALFYTNDAVVLLDILLRNMEQCECLKLYLHILPLLLNLYALEARVQSILTVLRRIEKNAQSVEDKQKIRQLINSCQ